MVPQFWAIWYDPYRMANTLWVILSYHTIRMSHTVCDIWYGAYDIWPSGEILNEFLNATFLNISVLKHGVPWAWNANAISASNKTMENRNELEHLVDFFFNFGSKYLKLFKIINSNPFKDSLWISFSVRL